MLNKICNIYSGYAPYGNIVPRETIKERNYSAIFEKKSKDVAWVVSNCNTISKREQYVEKMRKIINDTHI
jgi:glutamate racemase